MQSRKASGLSATRATLGVASEGPYIVMYGQRIAEPTTGYARYVVDREA